MTRIFFHFLATVSAAWEPATPLSTGSLLKMQILRLDPGTTESESAFSQAPESSVCMLTVLKHGSGKTFFKAVNKWLRLDHLKMLVKIADSAEIYKILLSEYESQECAVAQSLPTPPPRPGEA